MLYQVHRDPGARASRDSVTLYSLDLAMAWWLRRQTGVCFSASEAGVRVSAPKTRAAKEVVILNISEKKVLYKRK